MGFSLKTFQVSFEAYQKHEKLSIRYTKEKNQDIIHIETKIYTKDGHYYVKSLRLNETQNTKQIIGEAQEITEESLQEQHAYLAALFTALTQPTSPELSSWRSFNTSKSKIKWLVRACLLDTKLVGGFIGPIIANAANKENPHYLTVPSQYLAKTLGPLIFPAGLKKPKFEERGLVVIDSILHKQYKALARYNPEYTKLVNGEQKQLCFAPTKVSMLLDEQEIFLDTIRASNELVDEQDPNHLHVIYFNGNSGCYQQDYKLVAEDLLAYAAESVPVTAIQFNYPGVVSKGEIKVAQQLVDAGFAQVQALLDAGVPHHQIVLHGVSLGGCIACHVAARFNALEKTDNPNEKQTLGGVYAAKTLATLAQVGKGFFSRALGDNIFSRAIATFCLPFIKLGTWGSEWDLDTGKAFFSLPESKREYSVVLSSKANRKAYQKEHRGNRLERMGDFILQRHKSPADDAILRRGLHDCWERKWESFRAKFKNKEARQAYSEANHRRKMVVVNLTDGKLATDIDGHAVASYCYKQGEEDQKVWFNPHQEKHVFGLVHRIESTIFREEHVNLAGVTVENFDEHEASYVARQSILRMIAPVA